MKHLSYDQSIINLLQYGGFFQSKNKIKEDTHDFITKSFSQSHFSNVIYHEVLDNFTHFDKILKDNFIFINQLEYQLKTGCFQSGLTLFKEVVELLFQQYFKTSSFPPFKNLSHDFSKNELLKSLEQNRDLSIYFLPEKFRYNKYYFLSHIYQYADAELTLKFIETYPLTEEMISKLYQYPYLDNTALSKFIIKYQLEKEFTSSKSKIFHKI